MLPLLKKKPKATNALAEFMRNAPAREQKRVFKRVIEESIEDQQAIIEQAARIKAGQKSADVPGHSRFSRKTD